MSTNCCTTRHPPSSTGSPRAPAAITLHLDITTRLIQAAPVNALRDESVDAMMTVVGAKKSSRLAEAILGSVASAIAAVNPAPVAVVHPDHPVDQRGPVIIGIDRSRASAAAIEFAFAEAAARSTELMAVHAWNPAVFTDRLPGNLSDQRGHSIRTTGK